MRKVAILRGKKARSCVLPRPLTKSSITESHLSLSLSLGGAKRLRLRTSPIRKTTRVSCRRWTFFSAGQSASFPRPPKKRPFSNFSSFFLVVVGASCQLGRKTAGQGGIKRRKYTDSFSLVVWVNNINLDGRKSEGLKKPLSLVCVA